MHILPSAASPSSTLLIDTGGGTYLVQVLATRHLPAEGTSQKGGSVVVHTLVTTELTMQTDTTGESHVLERLEELLFLCVVGLCVIVH